MSGPESVSRDEQAIEWFVALQEHELSLCTLQQWERWIADPSNSDRFTAIVTLWLRAAALGPISLPGIEALAADTYDGSEALTSWLERQHAATVPGSPEHVCSECIDCNPTRHDPPHEHHRWRLTYGAAAALCAAAATCGMMALYLAG